MKKWNRILVSSLLSVSLLAGCQNSTQSTQVNADDDTIQVVTTIFPEYDWVRQIIGENNENIEVTLLLDNGVDMHSYQPTADDIISISSADVFIYVGGESDEWVESALQEAINPDMKVINLLDVLGDEVKEEEIVEGMEEDSDHDHEEDEHDHDEDEHDHDEVIEYDEHVWLSLTNAEKYVSYIADTLAQIDTENRETYLENAIAYNTELVNLSDQYNEAVKSATYDTILFGDRFPFRYLVDDYNLSYYAAFVGCSAETEASFETVTFLAQKVDEYNLPVVLTLENSDQKLAQTIVDNTQSKEADILVMDSMQSTTSKDIENGATYISIMENNLEVLKTALN